MRPQPNPNQDSGEQKKSVFDRLGRQLESGRPSNRGSPAHYGEHPMHQVMHDADFGRFGRGEPHPDMSWRYYNDRRNMHFGRDRHQPSIGPYPPPQFDMNMPPGRQPPQYFQHPNPHQAPYPSNQPGPPSAQLIGPDLMAMGIQQRRPSPKYDRHGNLIRGPMRMDQPSGMSSPGNFTGLPPPGPMMHPTDYDMMQMRPGMFPQNRWHENLEIGPPIHERLMQDDRFLEGQRFQQQQQLQQQQKVPQMNNLDGREQKPNFEAPRYSKWRERRDVITNLDRQTAQSSSKTDSLKSSLQQPDTKNHSKKKDSRQVATDRSATSKDVPTKKPDTGTTTKNKQSVAKPKADPSEISDGEIIDDEDSSDESDNQKMSANMITTDRQENSPITVRKTPYGRISSENQHYYEAQKRRRLHDREDYPMDYETISDEELDDFMIDKKLVDDGNLDGNGPAEDKSSSEIELLNALGLDWANLVELSRQSRKEKPTSGTALGRFAVRNYLPTLGITRELAGAEIYNLILKVCH